MHIQGEGTWWNAAANCAYPPTLINNANAYTITYPGHFLRPLEVVAFIIGLIYGGCVCVRGSIGISGSQGIEKYDWFSHRYAVAQIAFKAGGITPRALSVSWSYLGEAVCKKDTFQNWLLRFGHVTRAVVTWRPNTGFSLVMCTKIAPWPSAVTSVRICKIPDSNGIFWRFWVLHIFFVLSDVNCEYIAFGKVTYRKHMIAKER